MDEIDQFWRWWKRAADGLAKAFDSGAGLSEEQIDEISDQVKAMGDLALETRPGNGSRHHFALSAEGDAELRVLTQRWLARAPAKSDAWEFFAARQPSGADARLSVSFGQKEFTFGDFTLQVTRDEDRERFDLTIHHPAFVDLADDACYPPTFLALDNVLGEDGVVRWVGAIDLSRTPLEGGVPLGALNDELAAVANDWKGDRTWMLEGETAGGYPLLAVINSSLKRLDYLLHDHHYELALEIVDVTEKGLPDGEENQDLNEFEDELMNELGHAAVWVGHETYEGKRFIHFHADSSPALQKKVEDLLELDGRWEGELTVRYDPAWEILDKY
jgi:hypothetical protein